MHEFLRLHGSTFWFRRKLPKALAERLDVQEFACSLRTGSRREAAGRWRRRSAIW